MTTELENLPCLKPEPGKRYLMRCGKPTLIIKAFFSERMRIIAKDTKKTLAFHDGLSTWFDDGSYLTMSSHELDIVQEYTEAPLTKN